MTDQAFEHIDFTKAFLDSSYLECTFVGCRFTRADLSSILFEGCTFVECDLSNAKVLETGFQETVFERCKIMGVLFETAKVFLFSIEARESVFNHTSFFGVDLQNSTFAKCTFEQSDFSNALCQGVHFFESSFYLARFENTALQRADFTSARDFSIDPNINKVKGTRFSKDNLSGLLDAHPIEIV